MSSVDTVLPLEQARRAMARSGQWSPGQLMGRMWPIGCVALEITQRCNLDCTLCYLSESSEALHDLPLEEVFRRIDEIRATYGEGANVQITGGEPTLRARPELVAIVRRAVAAGLRPALFTNGIRASRALLTELCGAGLREVAFHVDTTQRRKGYAGEESLNPLREEYIARAGGLPLSVYFNTTVHDANFADVPALARFFLHQSGRVALASFQLQADAGRGVLRERGAAITPETVGRQIERGVGTRLTFDAVAAGHARCNRYGIALVANRRAYDALDDASFAAEVLAHAATLPFDRRNRARTLAVFLRHAAYRPVLLGRCLVWAARKAWQMRRDLVAARGRLHKLSFFIHNFMDSGALDEERIGACAFTVAARDGPVSMCLYNAKRDAELRKPVPIVRSGVVGFWNPVTGKLDSHPNLDLGVNHTRKTAKGRALERYMIEDR